MARPNEDNSAKGPIRFAWIPFALFAYGAMGAGAYFLVANSVFWATAESTDGTVVGFERMEGTHNPRRLGMDVDRARANVVSFQIGDEEHVFVTEWGSEAAVYDPGDTVTVLYRAEDPANAKVLGFMSLYLGPLLLIVFGAGFWIVSLLAKFLAE